MPRGARFKRPVAIKRQDRVFVQAGCGTPSPGRDEALDMLGKIIKTYQGKD
jgi:hypothetical protein